MRILQKIFNQPLLIFGLVWFGFFGVISFTFVQAQGCGNPGGTCFLAGTSVTMSDGSKKPIEEITVGEIVLGYDAINKKFTNNIVEEVEAPTALKWYEVALENEAILNVTKDHPLLIKKSMVQRDGAQLNLNSQLLLESV